MIKKYFLLIFSLFLLDFSSCVSKKKFLEMQDGRLKAEELSRKLSDENDAKAERIKALIADFESMKNELLESNAVKDNYIDTLNRKIFVLNEDLNKREESLQETSFNLDFEKQRLTNALKSKDNTIQSLNEKIEELKTEVYNVNTVVNQKDYEIGKLKDQAQVLENKIEAGDSKIDALQSELQKAQADTEKLQSQMKEKDATIMRLENNVKLLKKEMGK